MSVNFKVLFFLKKGRNSKPVSLPIYVRVTINGQRAEWSIQRNCDPARWNQQAGRVSGSYEMAKVLNNFLDAIQGSIYEIQKEYTLRNEPVTTEQVRARMLHKSEEKKHSLVEVYQYHNDQFEKLVGAEFSYGTLKKFRSALTQKVPAMEI